MKNAARIGLALGAAMSLVLTACGSSGGGGGGGGGGGSTSGSYVVGSSQELTGAIASLGVPFIAGFQTSIDEVNAAGGVNGRKIVLKDLDDAGDPDRTVSNTKQLISDKPVAFLAPISSADGLAALPTLQAAKVPSFAYTAVEAMLPSPYYYAVGLDGTDAMNIGAQYIKSKASGRPRIAFLALNSPATGAAIAETKKYVSSLGWKVVGEELYDVQNPSFGSVAAKIKNDRPDYIIAAADDGNAPGMMTALKNAGVTVPVVNFEAGNAEGTFKSIGSSQFIAVRDFVDPSDSSSDAAAMRAAAKKYGTAKNATGVPFTKGYVIGKLLAKALDSCGTSCTGSDVAKWLDNMSAPFSSGKLGPELKFSATSHSGTRSGTEYQWSASQGKAVPSSSLLTANGPAITVNKG